MAPRASYERYLNRFGWFCVAPSVVLFSVFMAYPILSSLYYVTRRYVTVVQSRVSIGRHEIVTKPAPLWLHPSDTFTWWPRLVSGELVLIEE